MGKHISLNLTLGAAISEYIKGLFTYYVSRRGGLLSQMLTISDKGGPGGGK